MAAIRNLSGTGTLADGSLINYSYSEDATPTDMNTSSVGAGQVNSTIAVSDNPRGERLLVNNQIEITDPYFGTLEFTARGYSEGDNTASLTGETIGYKLNSYRVAGPHGGASSSVYTAILYYCGLAGISPVIAPSLVDKLEAIPANFIGWAGSVWKYLESLCTAVQIDSEGGFLEMAVIGDELHFREGLKSEIDLSRFMSNKSMQIESYDAAQFINLYSYNTRYLSDGVVREQSAAKNVFAINENVSISDSLQVEAGATLIKRIKINASLESINQPVAVGQISQLPFPSTHPTGEYVVVGADDYPINPTQWASEGGKLEIFLTDAPDEIEIRLTAPKSVQMPTVDGSPVEVTNAPYKIGVEVADGFSYPAFYVTGTGVFFDKTRVTIPTGASSEYTPNITSSDIDNIFVTNKNNMISRAVTTAQAMCGPKVVVSATVQDGVSFGETIGSIMSDYDTKLRITNLSFNEASASLIASSFVKFSDFNEAWTGVTFAQFDAVNAGMSFNEFTIIPLVKE